MKYYVGDFETSVYTGQQKTEVWSSALCPIPDDSIWGLHSDDVIVHNSIMNTYMFLRETEYRHIIVYYHNLKFDGTFWLDFLLRMGYKNAIDNETGKWKKTSEMKPYEMKSVISTLGQWYSITFITTWNHKKTIVELRDSLKLLPYSVREIGISFGTQFKKLDMEYKGERHQGGIITEEELAYIRNDVLVMSEALHMMLSEGYNKTTIGACCVKEYKKTLSGEDYNRFYPNLEEFILPTGETADSYVRDSYKGGWCYVNPVKRGRIISNGITLDVNSLYPSMMHSTSGNFFPVGKPLYCEPADFKSKYRNEKSFYYFIRFSCKFSIKDGYLPFVQIKNSVLYNGREHLLTSDIQYKGKHYESYINEYGETMEAKPTLTMTMTDYYLFIEHYNVYELEILDYLVFYSAPADLLFDAYIDYFMEIKKKETGAKRQQAKLFLNNLYGKTATSNDSSYKLSYLDKDANCVKYKNVIEYEKDVWYIPIGSAITSYARNFTIKAAQMNIDNFCYADTDSIHCDCTIKEIKGCTLDNKELCCWKHEATWEEAIFVRAKTYIERVGTHYDIKCAGMGESSKQLLRYVLGENVDIDLGSKDVRDFVSYHQRFNLNDFHSGLAVPLKLTPKTIEGGMILVDSVFTIK